MNNLEGAVFDALEPAGCPVCRLTRSAAYHYLDSLIYEAVNDPGVRAALERSGGFCPPHFWLLTRVENPAGGVTMLTQALLEEPPRLPRQYAAHTWIGSGAPCPACEVQAQAEDRYESVIRKHAARPEWRGAYSTGASLLCRPHALRCGQDWQDETARKEAALRAELAEFTRKQDYRFAHEPLGSEGNAWRRAVAVLAGLGPEQKGS
ncbi:DUF6062 family protein [Deinococcus aluminii]|uniref:Phage protein n=1 Tax=Deinococcus aluminii TaxID=1656885 RepID=A0ABP9XFF9_9DEIO